MKKAKSYWVYMLKMENGDYYTGYTNDIARRFLEHKQGKGGKYTKSFKPRRLAQCWKVRGVRGTAMKVESFIKGRPRVFKDALIKKPRTLKKAISDKFAYEFDIKSYDPRNLVV